MDRKYIYVDYALSLNSECFPLSFQRKKVSLLRLDDSLLEIERRRRNIKA